MKKLFTEFITLVHDLSAIQKCVFVLTT